MSNDMGEIEAALDAYAKAFGDLEVAKELSGAPGADEAFEVGIREAPMARDKLLSLIREKLAAARREPPPADVQAWADELTRVSIHCGGAMQMVQKLRDEGVRLMQRPSDAEHEAKVEAWHESVAACRLDGLRTEQGWSVYGIPYTLLDDAKSLMRARPAATDTAAGEAMG